MKNRHTENLKRKAKALHKSNSRNRHCEDGVRIFHSYEHHNDLDRLTWWDDCGFILNDYKVSVAWQHPRYLYSSQVEDLAYSIALEKFPDAASELGEKSSRDFLEDSIPRYIKVGKSRKKIKFYAYNSTEKSEIEIKRMDEWQRLEDKLALESDIKVTPTISSEWASHARFVSICIPIEVRNNEDVKVLASIVKSLLKRETTLDELFPCYVYSKDDWIAETEKRVPNDLHSHALA